jgi:hypothetical protein
MSNQLDATVAKRLDISVRQGQTFNAIITLLNDSGGPINIEGATVKMSVRQGNDCGAHSCSDQAFSLDFNQVYKQDFIPEIGGGNHNVLQFFQDVILADGNYKYDLLIEYPNELKQYILFGTFKVKKSYTSI